MKELKSKKKSTRFECPFEKTTFKKIVIVILARDEVHSLQETVESLAALCPPEDVERIVMYLAPNAVPECREMAKWLEDTVTTIPVYRMLQQTQDPLEEFLSYYPLNDQVTHYLMLAADMEIEPQVAVQMLQACKENPNALISLTRWKAGGGFSGYPKWQLPLHWTFQQVVRVMYRARLATDATAGYAAVPKTFYGIRLREKRQSIFLEYKLVFLRLNVPLIEIPVHYRARREGKSTGSFWHKVRYLVPLFRVRFTPRKKLFQLGGNTHG